MLSDSERFASIPQRIHSFASTGNAYDATQIDERIASGDALLILSRAWSALPVAGPCGHAGDGQSPRRSVQAARDAG
jgi:hypothetical protein